MPELEKPEKYVGLYVVDFGDNVGVGFTAEEVGELLESEKYADVKVYKIHRASPEGQMELKGVPGKRFQLESAMLFYAGSQDRAQADFKNLISLAVSTPPPCRARVQLADLGGETFATALIYPAEYEDEVSAWLIGGDYKTVGGAEGGPSALQNYYDRSPEILDRHQLFAGQGIESRSGQELLENLKVAVQR